MPAPNFGPPATRRIGPVGGSKSQSLQPHHFTKLLQFSFSSYAMRHALSGLILKFSNRFDRPLYAKARGFQTRKMSSPSGRTYAVSLTIHVLSSMMLRCCASASSLPGNR